MKKDEKNSLIVKTLRSEEPWQQQQPVRVAVACSQQWLAALLVSPDSVVRVAKTECLLQIAGKKDGQIGSVQLTAIELCLAAYTQLRIAKAKPLLC